MFYGDAQSTVAFVRNLSEILMDFKDNFHLKSSFKAKYIFLKSISECNGHFDHWFSNTVGSQLSAHGDFPFILNLKGIGKRFFIKIFKRLLALYSERRKNTV